MFILEKLAKYRMPKTGLTIMHHAVRHAIKTQDTSYLMALLQIGFPIYEASNQGHSILKPVFEIGTKIAIATEIFELVVRDRKFNLFRQLSMPPIAEVAHKEINLYMEIFNQCSEMRRIDSRARSFLGKICRMQEVMHFWSFDSDKFEEAYERVRAGIANLIP